MYKMTLGLVGISLASSKQTALADRGPKSLIQVA